MTGEGRLRLLEPHLAQLIREASQDAALREFACRCADFALHTTGLADEQLQQALDVAFRMETSAVSDEQIEQVRTAVSELVDQLDEAAFDQQDAVEAGQGSEEAYAAAFSLARAATSVQESLDQPARKAAAEACYEAFAATEDLASIQAMAQKILGR